MQDAVLWVMTMSSPVQCLWTCFSLCTSLSLRFHIPIFSGDVIFIYIYILTRNTNVTKCKDFLLNKFHLLRAQKCQYKFSLFISLSDIYMYMNRWRILIQKFGLVERYSMWHYTVPLDQTSGSEFSTHINISDILPDETSHMQFGLVNVRWSMVTIWEKLPPPPLLLPWRWQATFSCAILGLHSVTMHNTKISNSVLHFFCYSIFLKLVLPSSFLH
jgi:hypothetical protein